MTVYIDDMYLYPMGQFGRLKMSHMVADTEEELHALAGKIGMKRAWFQGDHYDVSKAKRTEAIAHGAVEITLQQCAFMCGIRAKLGGGPLPAPEAADKLRAELYAKAVAAREGAPNG